MPVRRDSKNRKLNKGEYQKPDGRYAYRYLDKSGQERWIYSWALTATDRAPEGKEAGRCLRDLEIDISKSLMDGVNSYEAERTTLNEYFETYMGIKSGLKDRTRAHYRYYWSKFIADSIGCQRLCDIRYSDVVRFLNRAIDQKKMKPNSARQLYHLIHPVLNLAVHDELIRKNPADDALSAVMKNRKSKQEKRHSLTEEQQETFLNFLRGIPKYRRWYRLFIFLLGTGCRIGEARGLIWSDCDFAHKLIYVNRQVQYYRGEEDETYCEHVTDPKSSSGIRMIPMFDVVRDVLLEEQAAQVEAGWEEKSIGNVSGFIFRTRNGGCIDCRNVDGAIYRLVENYNKKEMELAKSEGRDPILMPRFSVHNLRHTFCTRMCENETNLKVIQEVMGHADISTTMNIYNEAQIKVKVQSFEHLEGKIVRA